MFAVCTPVYAKTFHLAKWGANSLACGTTSAPCLTLNWIMLFLAGKNDKVIVQPGVYVENVDITAEGVKIESVAGRAGTIFEASNPGDHVISIQASRVQFGKKGKGFTVRGASGAGSAGVQVDSEVHTNTKVEGNAATGNDIGFLLQGEKVQVRNNKILDTVSGHGIFCSECVRGLFQENIIMNAGSVGIFLDNSQNVSVFRNGIYGSTGTGIYLLNGSDFGKIQDNVIFGAGGFGIEVASNSSDGMLVQGNIASEPSVSGLLTNSDGAETKRQTIKNNLVVNDGFQGYDVDTAVPGLGAIFDSNISVGSAGAGVQLDAGTEIKSFKNNTTYASGNGLGIDNNSGNDFTYKKHFWGDPSGPDPDGADGDTHDALDDGGNTVTGTDANKPNAFKAKKAAAL